jgi:pyruvate,water dikinase
MADKWIYWLRELGTEHNNIVGKKCANLGELTKAGFHVPPGFALGVGAYERFMKETVASDRLLEYLKTFKALGRIAAELPGRTTPEQIMRYAALEEGAPE